MKNNESGVMCSTDGTRKRVVFRLAKEWFAPLCVWALVMLLIGFGVGSKSAKAIAPPRHDAMEYFQKARTTWQCLSKGDWRAVLEAMPTHRPPLSALILYPLGFDTSLQSFLFRSTFAPILLASLALLIPLAFIAVTRLERILAVAMACAGASMPMLYHFEENSIELNSGVDSFWGLVDPLFAAFSALAVAFVIIGVQRRSWAVGLAGWGAVALAIFIKPTGVLIGFVALGISWVEGLIRILQDTHLKFGEGLRRNLITRFFCYDVLMTLFAAGLCAATVTIALRSSYLDKDHVEVFVAAAKMVRDSLTGRPFVPVLLTILPETLGWFWLMALLGLVLFALRKIRWSFDPVLVGLTIRLVGCALMLGCALYWWWFIASPLPRYLFPFLLIPVVWFSQDIFNVTKRRSVGAQRAAVAYFVAPTLGVVMLLWLPTPPPAIQKLLGVNLTTGTFAQEVALGHQLLAECADQQKQLTLYSLSGMHSLCGVRGGIALGVQQYIRGVLDRPGYSCNVIGPIDWFRVPGVRLDEFVSADLVLCDRWIPDHLTESAPVSPRSYEEEIAAVAHFVNTTTKEDGILLIFDGGLRAYRIVDREKLAAALVRWVKSVRWGTAFPEHNKSFLAKNPEVRSPNNPP